MAVNVFDTSALGKHYHPEIGAARVDQLLGVVEDVQAISRFSVVELYSVFAKKVRRSGTLPWFTFGPKIMETLSRLPARLFPSCPHANSPHHIALCGVCAGLLYAKR